MAEQTIESVATAIQVPTLVATQVAAEAAEVSKPCKGLLELVTGYLYNKNVIIVLVLLVVCALLYYKKDMIMSYFTKSKPAVNNTNLCVPLVTEHSQPHPKLVEKPVENIPLPSATKDEEDNQTDINIDLARIQVNENENIAKHNLTNSELAEINKKLDMINV